MPYAGLNPDLVDKVDACVEDVMRKQGVDKSRAIAICRASIEKEQQPTLTVFKQTNGDYRWITRSTNAYRDNDGEIVSTKSLEHDAARMEATGDFGPLRWWHVPGIDVGQCDFSVMQGRTRIESGTFKSKEVAEGVAKASPGLAVSIGFTHPTSEPDSGGVYHNIRVFERSLLPKAKAANPFTSVSVKEFDMATLSEKWKEFVQGVFGGDEQAAQKFAVSTEETQKAVEAAGVKFKEGDGAGDGAGDTETAKAKKELPQFIKDNMKPSGKPGDKPEEDDEEDEEDKPEEEMKAKPKRKERKAAPLASAVRTIGDLTPDEFLTMVKEAAGQVLAEQQATATKERDAERAALTEQIDGLTTRLKALEGDQPPAAREAHVASTDPSTVSLTETLKAMAGAMPADDRAKFAAFMFPTVNGK